jgi:hypothetical protein
MTVEINRSRGTVGILPATVLLVTLGLGCSSPSAPESASSSVPATSPAVPPPVAAANVVFMPAPAQVPGSPNDPIVGRYTLDVLIGTRSGLRCELVPEHATRRRYTADIHDVGNTYAVTLYDATFLKDAATVSYGCRDRRLPRTGICNQFLISPESDSTLRVTIEPEDEWRGSEIWEFMVQESRLLQIHGLATGLADDGRIEAAGRGGLWYGNGLPASVYSSCGPGDLHLNFVRR